MQWKECIVTKTFMVDFYYCNTFNSISNSFGGFLQHDTCKVSLWPEMKKGEFRLHKNHYELQCSSCISAPKPSKLETCCIIIKVICKNFLKLGWYLFVVLVKSGRSERADKLNLQSNFSFCSSDPIIFPPKVIKTRISFSFALCHSWWGPPNPWTESEATAHSLHQRERTFEKKKVFATQTERKKLNQIK